MKTCTPSLHHGAYESVCQWCEPEPARALKLIGPADMADAFVRVFDDVNDPAIESLYGGAFAAELRAAYRSINVVPVDITFGFTLDGDE